MPAFSVRVQQPGSDELSVDVPEVPCARGSANHDLVLAVSKDGDGEGDGVRPLAVRVVVVETGLVHAVNPARGDIIWLCCKALFWRVEWERNTGYYDTWYTPVDTLTSANRGCHVRRTDEEITCLGCLVL